MDILTQVNLINTNHKPQLYMLATYREPLKGWIDNIYGPTGVVVGVGTGILKTLHCKGGVVADMVPADYVINAMIAATYKTAVERPKEVPVYNYVSSVENRITWNDLRTAGYQCGEYVPTIRAVTPPSLTLNRYKSMHMLYVLLLHFLPAIIVDTFMVVMGKKPFLVNVYKKVHKFSNVLAYFCTQEWKFHNDNVQALWKELPGADRRVFPFSMGDFSWEEFHFNHLLGLRVYIVKDDLSTLPQARIRMQRLKVLQKVFMLAVCALIGWMIYVSICSVSKILFH